MCFEVIGERAMLTQLCLYEEIVVFEPGVKVSHCTQRVSVAQNKKSTVSCITEMRMRVS